MSVVNITVVGSCLRCVRFIKEKIELIFDFSFILYHVAAAAAALSKKMGWILSSSEFRPSLFPWQQSSFTLGVGG